MDTAHRVHFLMMMFRLYLPRLFLNRFLFLLPILFLSAACSPQPTPTPFRPPTAILPTQPLPTTTPVPALFTPTFTPTITATPTEGPCANVLSFLDDVTVEDGSVFAPGAAIDKQWLVQNSGTCDWDADYKLKWVGGTTLGAAEEQPLYPAKAGTQATLRILFTAPAEPGTYQTTWQAVDPDGNFFGDTVFMEIVVQ
ncbi:MAG: hypothetical protein DPW18_05175 [Chloroflexi bacterium]|nr:hypothetical protein [Chloroflexota bacterium]